jgi:hypothetical protein
VIDQFLNQKALWERRIPGSEDVYGNPQFEPGLEIPVRLVRRRRTFRTEPGDVIITERSVMTRNAVQTGDRMSYQGESFVIQVGPNEAIWLDGAWWGAWCHG